MKKLYTFVMLVCLFCLGSLSPAVQVQTGANSLNLPAAADATLIAQEKNIRYSPAAGITGAAAVYRYRVLWPMESTDLRVSLIAPGQSLAGTIAEENGLITITFDPVRWDFVPTGLRFYRGAVPIYYLPVGSDKAR